MQISSAYLYGSGMSEGQVPPLPDNVYFDNGRFNLNIIPSGFDFENNIQRFPIGAAGTGETYISHKGYFEQYIKTGAILASYGGGGREFILTPNGLEHSYDQGYYQSNYFWTSYFLPVEKDMWNTGLTKLCANVAVSSEGKSETNYMGFDLAYMYHDPAYDASVGFTYMFDGFVSLWEASPKQLVEHTLKAPFGDMYHYANSEFIYILIRVPDSGTHIVRKIWFE